MSAPPLLVIVGPTASGKSALAVQLAEALSGEVISADSVQIYRHFDIGSGKPSAEERRGIPHHLIDALDPLEPIDAADYAARAERAIDEVRARGKLPIVCGGTFLWVRALLYGLVPTPPKDERLRDQHREIAASQGRAALHAQLAQVDPSSAQRLSANDFVRVSRALEVFQITGRTISALQAEHGFRTPRQTPLLLGIRYTPDELTARISERSLRMLAQGWVDEVRRLLAQGYAQARAMASVGYREVAAALNTADPPQNDALLSAVVQKTRVFARRQRTWLREQPVTWLEPEQVSTSATVNIANDLLSQLTRDAGAANRRADR